MNPEKAVYLIILFFYKFIKLVPFFCFSFAFLLAYSAGEIGLIYYHSQAGGVFFSLVIDA